MTSIDTVPLNVNFGHLLTGSNFSDRPHGGGGGGGGGDGDGGGGGYGGGYGGDGDNNGNNNRDNGLGGRWGSMEYFYCRRSENTVDSTVDDSIVVGEE